MTEFHREQYSPAAIKVMAVDGADGNAINTMIKADLRGVQFIAVNADVQGSVE